MRDHEPSKASETYIEARIQEAADASILRMMREKLSSYALEEANENDDPESYSQRFNEMLDQLLNDAQLLFNNPLEIEIRLKIDPNDPA